MHTGTGSFVLGHGPITFREASHQQDLLKYLVFYLLLVCQSKYKLTFKDHQTVPPNWEHRSLRKETENKGLKRKKTKEGRG